MVAPSVHAPRPALVDAVRNPPNGEVLMQRQNFPVLALAAFSVLTLAACGEQRAPTEVTRSPNPTVAFSKEDQHAGAIVAHDRCDPASFDAALQDPNACVKNGNETFDQFIAELQANHVASGWRFTPDQITGRLGVGLLGNNVGGEAHTFTPVHQFGGGFVDILNQLSGNLVPAPECLNLEEDDAVASGGKYLIEADELAEVTDAGGIARVQCCIHPWMRTEVRMKG